MNLFRKKRRIYLDHAAATPVLASVLREMKPYFADAFGNPSAIHQEGVRARKVVEEARTLVARTLSVRPADITFTSGGTESNNLALRGAVEAMVAGGIPYEDIEIISTRTEHPSILRVLDLLAAEGCTITYIPVHETGSIDMAALESALTQKTRLVTIAYANSETGIVQDIGRIGRVLERFEKKENTEILMHIDASQAPLWLPCAPDHLRVDLMTLDAGKFGGPKGVGVLVHRSRVRLVSVLKGGSQEEGVRPGTENVPLIVGCARALHIAQSRCKERNQSVAKVRDHGIVQLCAIEGVLLNGSQSDRLPNNINISIPGIDTEFAVIALDASGIACSTKSACSGAGGGVSNVVFEMTNDAERARSTIRFTLGEETQPADMEYVAELLKEHIQQMSHFHTKFIDKS